MVLDGVFGTEEENPGDDEQPAAEIITTNSAPTSHL